MLEEVVLVWCCYLGFGFGFLVFGFVVFGFGVWFLVWVLIFLLFFDKIPFGKEFP